MGYKVSLPFGRWKYFDSMSDAAEYRNSIFQRTGVIATVVEYRKRKGR